MVSGSDVWWVEWSGGLSGSGVPCELRGVWVREVIGGGVVGRDRGVVRWSGEEGRGVKMGEVRGSDGVRGVMEGVVRGRGVRRDEGDWWGEYSCRCHGKRVISAPSKPLKLKLAGHII